MKARASIRLLVFKYMRDAGKQPRDAEQVAMSLDLEVEQVRPAMRWLAERKMIADVGGNERAGILFVFVEGATPPEDGRGKHKKHRTGPAWAAVRKRNANLQKAREKKKKKAIVSMWPLITKAIV